MINLDWFSMTQEEVSTTNNSFLIYQGSKTAADQAMLEFSKDHPELDISFGRGRLSARHNSSN